MYEPNHEFPIHQTSEAHQSHTSLTPPASDRPHRGNHRGNWNPQSFPESSLAHPRPRAHDRRPPDRDVELNGHFIPN